MSNINNFIRQISLMSKCACSSLRVVSVARSPQKVWIMLIFINWGYKNNARDLGRRNIGFSGS